MKRGGLRHRRFSRHFRRGYRRYRHRRGYHRHDDRLGVLAKMLLISLKEISHIKSILGGVGTTTGESALNHEAWKDKKKQEKLKVPEEKE